MAMAIKSPTSYEDLKYQQVLSKADVLILNFWPGWKEHKFGKEAMRNVVMNIKNINPDILIGQYTILSEAQDVTSKEAVKADVSEKLNHENWWLRGVYGEKVRWTGKYNAWDINFTEYTRADNNGFRYHGWLAKRNFEVFFKKIPELDFWYLDNSLSVSPIKFADWNGDGIPDISTLDKYSRAYRRGHVSYWDAVLNIQPGIMLVGNCDDISSTEYTGRLNGAFMEAMMGRSWSLEKKAGWKNTLLHYYSFMEHTSAPKLVGFNVWGKLTDYQLMRFGLTTTLLNNGYFSYTDESMGFASLPWFDEYDIDLGMPIDQPPILHWKNGVYKREYDNGLVLVNPGNQTQHITLPDGYSTFNGKQDHVVNNGVRVNEVTLKSRDGIILVKNGLIDTQPSLSRNLN
jgi:hypothetical protein